MHPGCLKVDFNDAGRWDVLEELLCGSQSDRYVLRELRIEWNLTIDGIGFTSIEMEPWQASYAAICEALRSKETQLVVTKQSFTLLEDIATPLRVISAMSGDICSLHCEFRYSSRVCLASAAKCDSIGTIRLSGCEEIDFDLEEEPEIGCHTEPACAYAILLRRLQVPYLRSIGINIQSSYTLSRFIKALTEAIEADAFPSLRSIRAAYDDYYDRRMLDFLQGSHVQLESSTGARYRLDFESLCAERGISLKEFGWP